MTLKCDTCGKKIKDLRLAMLEWQGRDNPDLFIVHHASEKEGCYKFTGNYYDVHLKVFFGEQGYYELCNIFSSYKIETSKAMEIVSRLYKLQPIYKYRELL